MIRFLFSENVLPPDALSLRKEIFTAEQGFPDGEEEKDLSAVHVLGYLKDTPISVARFFRDPKTGRTIVGRFGVKKAYRKTGIGKKMMEAIFEYLRKKGIHKVYLHAQKRAVGFYQSLGFQTEGGFADEEGYPHIWMDKEF